MYATCIVSGVHTRAPCVPQCMHFENVRAMIRATNRAQKLGRIQTVMNKYMGTPLRVHARAQRIVYTSESVCTHTFGRQKAIFYDRFMAHPLQPNTVL